MNTIVFGLDGASYELIYPWIKGGDLPNLGRFRRNGIYGDLESQLPPVTCPNWKCYSTGKNPAKLGLFWWENVDWEEESVYCPDYRSKENEEIWDYLNKDGKKVSVINIPTSYPPKKIHGYLISGGPDSGNDGFYNSPDLRENLESLDYKVRPNKSISSSNDCREIFDEIVDLMDSRFKLLENLLEEDSEISFAHMTIFLINVLHHFLWDDNLVKDAWKEIDKNIGRFIDRYGKDFNIFLMSDHGSNKIETVFNVNTWLEKEGYLKINKGSLMRILEKLGLNRYKVVKLAEIVGLKSLLSSFLPASVVSSIPSAGGGVTREAKGRLMNWEESTAVASGQGPLYLNKRKLGNSYEEFREDLIGKLEILESPKSGRRVVRRVYRKEEIYSGKYLDKAPDLVIDQAPNVHIPGEIGKEEVFEDPGKWAGENKRTGLFAAMGPDIKEEGSRVDVSILDLAPTLLHLNGLAVPRDMDGRVLRKVYREGSDPADRDVVFSGKGEETQRVKDRISKLKRTGSI